MKKKLTHVGIFSVFLIILGLYGCGGSDSNSTDAKLAPYYQQTISWHTCSSDSFTNLDTDLLNQLSSRTSCATVNVPLDYDDVSKGSVSIGVLRVTAAKPASRLGAIWFNPGGPGGSGLNFPLALAQLFSITNPADPVGVKLQQLPESYDLIGFDPRGVGSSVQLICTSSAANGFVTYTDRSATTINAQISDARAIASACGGNPLTQYINTEYTARDMEVMRVALGYNKLNYYGASYGTVLGARYASLFPDTTGRMVLDSVVDITTPLAEYFSVQPPALQKILDGIVAPFVANNNSVFGLGSNADDIRAISRSGPAWLTSWLGIAMYNPLFDQARVSLVVGDLAVAKGLASVFAANPTISPNDLQQQIATLQFFPQGDADDEAVALQIAASALDAYRDFFSGNTEPLKFDGTNQAVICNDGALINQTQQFWTDLGNSLAQSAPLRGGRVTEQACLYWPFAPRKLPTFERAATLPILLLQDAEDGSTPLAGANATAAVLKGSRMVVQDTTYSHGALLTSSSCVSSYFADYMLNGALPQNNVTCAGTGLISPTATTMAQATLSASPSPSSAASEPASEAVPTTQPTDMYSDPAQAEKLLQKLRDMVR
jgi:pimeloyl-ACP methyl ester carboxylesterase